MTAQNMTAAAALRLANPRSWVAAIYPALFGALYCLAEGYPLTVQTGILLLLACVLMQSAVNTLNDYFDFVKGTDQASDFVEKRDAVLIYEGIAPKQALGLGLAFLAAAAAVALPVVLSAGMAPLVIGIIGGLAVLTYSGGILPLSYLPVGEFVSGLVMGGLIPMGVVASATGRFDVQVLWWSAPFIVGIGLIMMTNNTCDIEKDRQARRRTFPAVLGRCRARCVYRGAVLLWIILLCLMPLGYMGGTGAVSALVLLTAGRKVFGMLLTTSLEPQKRVEQMKGIVLANVIGNGAYILALLSYLAAGGLW